MNLLPYYATQTGANLPKEIEHLIDFQKELLAGAVTPQQHPKTWAYAIPVHKSCMSV